MRILYIIELGEKNIKVRNVISLPFHKAIQNFKETLKLSLSSASKQKFATIWIGFIQQNNGCLIKRLNPVVS